MERETPLMANLVKGGSKNFHILFLLFPCLKQQATYKLMALHFAWCSPIIIWPITMFSEHIRYDIYPLVTCWGGKEGLGEEEEEKGQGEPLEHDNWQRTPENVSN